MFEATSRSELPNPQKALTKLTKAPRTTPFVSFVSGFLRPQISKQTCCRRVVAPFHSPVNFSNAGNIAGGRAM